MKISLVESILLEARIDFLRDKYINNPISNQEFNLLSESDPSSNKQFTQWLITNFIKEFYNSKSNNKKKKIFFEDLYKLSEYLDIFRRHQKLFKEKDINRYNFSSFKNEALKVKKEISKDVSLAGKGLTKTEKYKDFYLGEVAEYQVYEIPKGRKDLYGVSCELGSGTEWCTATGKTRDYFNSYISRGPLYIITNGKEKYQFHFESGSFMDREDEDIFKNKREHEKYKLFFEFLSMKKGIKIPLKVKLLLGIKLNKEDLKVSGSLILNVTTITSLPDNLEIKGSLHLVKTPITSLPNNLKVGEDILLSGTPITSLPDNLEVHGSLFLNATKIVSLPANLKVGEDLELDNTRITSLPSDLKVGKYIYAHHTPLSKNEKYLALLPSEIRSKILI